MRRRREEGGKESKGRKSLLIRSVFSTAIILLSLAAVVDGQEWTNYWSTCGEMDTCRRWENWTLQTSAALVDFADDCNCFRPPDWVSNTHQANSWYDPWKTSKTTLAHSWWIMFSNADIPGENGSASMSWRATSSLTSRCELLSKRDPG